MQYCNHWHLACISSNEGGGCCQTDLQSQRDQLKTAQSESVAKFYKVQVFIQRKKKWKLEENNSSLQMCFLCHHSVLDVETCQRGISNSKRKVEKKDQDYDRIVIVILIIMVITLIHLTQCPG